MSKQSYLAIFICMLLLSFAGLSSFIVHTPVLAYDVQIGDYVAHRRSGMMTEAMKVITFFGSQQFLLPAYLLLIFYYLRQRKTYSAINVAAVGIGGTASMFIFKQIFQRPRPLLPHLVEAGGFSYPSGHTFSSFLFFGLCMYLVYKGGSRYRCFYMAALFLLPCLVGYSRVYLGVHFASDVLAGFILSLLCLSIALTVILYLRKKRQAQVASFKR